MRKQLSIFALSALAFAGFTSCSSTSNEEWQQLFNGEDLDNWDIKISGYELGDNFGETFRVNDGLLQVRYDQYENGFEEKYGHIFHKESFSTYLLGAEYRFIGDQVEDAAGWAYRNNGLMLYGQEAHTMKLDQDYPNSIEVQLLGGDGENPRTTANICTPGTQFVKDGELITQHCVNSTSKTYQGDQWVRVDVLALKDSLIVHYVNGEEVLRYEKPQLDDGSILTGGSISVQSESHPTDFRTIEIVDLQKYENDPVALQQTVDRLLSQRNQPVK